MSPSGMATEHVVSHYSDKASDWYSPLVNLKSEITAEDVQALVEPNSHYENSREGESKLIRSRPWLVCARLHPSILHKSLQVDSSQ